MFFNNLKIAYRNLIRNKGYSFINISGLAIGMACTLLLLLWVNHEFSYDKFHKKEKQLFQIVNWQTYSGQEYGWPNIPGKLVDLMKEKTPEIVHATNYDPWGEKSLLSINGKKNYERIFHADADFFQMFSFPLLKGTAEKVFEDPYSIVISEKFAKKYFGNNDPIGQVIKLNEKYDITITGVLKNLPSNTIFDFDLLMSFEFKKKDWTGWESWGNHSYSGFVELDASTDPDTVSEKLSTFYVDNVEAESTERISLFPVSKTHLYSLEGKETNLKNIRIFLIIALFILLIACFNFMNLSTARASKRAKEIGLKKAIGSSKPQLIWQFLFESVLVSLIAINFAIILVRVFIPEFNNILGQHLQLDYTDWRFLSIMISVVLFTGLFAGAYPAFYITSYKTIEVLKGVTSSGKKATAFRKVLVVLQFTLTVFLLISTLTITLQTKYLKTASTGIDKSNVAFVVLNGNMNENLKSIKEELMIDPSILSSTFGSDLPINLGSNGGGYEWNNDESTKDVLVHMYFSDPDFIDVYKTPLVEGRFFNKDNFDADSLTLVINETFAKMIDKNSVIDKTIVHWGSNKRIIGVIKDFNYRGLQQKIGPMAFIPYKYYNFLAVKIETNSNSRALAHIEKVCQKYNPGFPTIINFLEDNYTSQYKEEESTIAILKYFSILTILISCLGLFGLASFMAEEKTKEIGVRKVLGATVSNLITLFSREFTKWVVLANIIAWPLAWYFMDNYLSKFAFRINMPWWVFLSVAMLVFAISIITVGYQSWKSATQNPIKSLKYE